jgi:hypothetical protein
VFENRVLRRIFGPKRDEVTGGWRNLHNLYFSPNVIRVEDEMGRECSKDVGMKNFSWVTSRIEVTSKPFL